jgi:hypothetical protein
VADFDPGITSNRIFWTLPVPDGSVAIDLRTGEATLLVENLPMPDYFDYENALLNQLLDPPAPGVPPAAGVVSFKCCWSGGTEAVPVRNTTDQFVGKFLADTASCEWVGEEEGFAFVSDPAATSTSVSALIGTERNGIYFE